jgi:ubiquitin C-terminal hydrolase
LTPYTQSFGIQQAQIYNLYAVSNHFGGLTGGHYTAQVLHHHNDTWYNLDDSRVSESRESEVQV